LKRRSTLSRARLAASLAAGLAASLTCMVPAFAAPAADAQSLVVNVHGYTLSGGDAQLHTFSALAFAGGKVLATGEAGELRRRFPQAKRVDGHGRTLLPGLIDAHGHVLELGINQVEVQLDDTTSLAQAQQRIRDYAKAHPDRGWILGFGWNQAKWQLGRFPVAAELDAVTDRPAVLERVDGHARWLNTRALQAAGITRDSPDPIGGRIEHDEAGNPSGVLVDNAMDLITKVVPERTPAERRAALKAAIAHLNSVGLTGAGDAGDSASTIALYRSLADAGELHARIYAMIGDTGADFAALAPQGPLLGYGQDRLTVRSVKLYADGALGSRGAALLAPYSDQPGQRGLLFEQDAAMEHKIETALRAGFQVNVHAIGDAANRQVLDGFEHAYAALGRGRELRNRIEHAQVVTPEDIPRFRQLDIIASMQPTHATSDMNMAEARIGPKRLEGAYAWHSFLAQGTRIAGGSDFPVESDNPFFGLHAAVTRQDHDGKPAGGWHAEQALTLPEAFRAFTLDAAWAQHQEASVGSLEPGKWADFILVDRDPFSIAPQDLWKVQVEQTWLAGERVYKR
jgi:predicted amidohydrolase YtcJ